MTTAPSAISLDDIIRQEIASPQAAAPGPVDLDSVIAEELASHEQSGVGYVSAAPNNAIPSGGPVGAPASRGIVPELGVGLARGLVQLPGTLASAAQSVGGLAQSVSRFAKAIPGVAAVGAMQVADDPVGMALGRPVMTDEHARLATGLISQTAQLPPTPLEQAGQGLVAATDPAADYFQSLPQRLGLQQSQKAGDHPFSMEGIASAVGENVPQLAVQLAAAYLTGGESLAGRALAFGASAAPMELGGAQQSGVQGFESQGVPHEEAIVRSSPLAAMQAAVNTIIEDMSGHGVLAPAQKAAAATGLLSAMKRYAKKAGMAMFAEGATEGVQEGVNIAGELGSGSNPDAMQGAGSRVAQAALIGGILGGGAGVVDAALHRDESAAPSPAAPPVPPVDAQPQGPGPLDQPNTAGNQDVQQAGAGVQDAQPTPWDQVIAEAEGRLRGGDTATPNPTQIIPNPITEPASGAPTAADAPSNAAPVAPGIEIPQPDQELSDGSALFTDQAKAEQYATAYNGTKDRDTPTVRVVPILDGAGFVVGTPSEEATAQANAANWQRPARTKGERLAQVKESRRRMFAEQQLNQRQQTRSALDKPGTEVAPVVSTETGNEPHKFSSTQVQMPDEVGAKLKAMGARIPDAELAPDGREADPHITVKYGLHGDDAADVGKLLTDQPPITLTLGKTSLFSGDEHDVVKVDADSPDMHALNKKVADALPHTDTHPTYQPHLTVAYVKPGMGKKYAGDASLDGQQVTVDTLVFSAKDGTRTEFKLTGASKAAPAVPAQEARSPTSTPTPADSSEMKPSGAPAAESMSSTKRGFVENLPAAGKRPALRVAAKPGQLDGTLQVSAFTPEGEYVGGATFGPSPVTDGVFNAYRLFVNESHRRMGVATALYDAAEKAGLTLEPDMREGGRKLSPDAAAFWKDRRAKKTLAAAAKTKKPLKQTENKGPVAPEHTLARLNLAPTPNLTPEQHDAEASMSAVAQDQQASDKLYNSINVGKDNTEGGKIVSTDLARHLSPLWKNIKDRLWLEKATVAVAKAWSRDRIMRDVKNLPAVAQGEQPVLLLTGGSPGSGKSTAVEGFKNQADKVWDSQMTNPDEAAKVIDEALAHGWFVQVKYVYRPFENTVPAILRRARSDNEGRPVLISDAIESRVRGQRAIAALAERYANNPMVDIAAVHNREGKEPVAVRVSDVAEGGRLAYTPEELRSIADAELKRARQSGEHEEAILRAVAGDQGPVPADSSGRDGRPGAGREEQPAQPVQRAAQAPDGGERVGQVGGAGPQASEVAKTKPEPKRLAQRFADHKANPPLATIDIDLPKDADALAKRVAPETVAAQEAATKELARLADRKVKLEQKANRRAQEVWSTPAVKAKVAAARSAVEKGAGVGRRRAAAQKEVETDARVDDHEWHRINQQVEAINAKIEAKKAEADRIGEELAAKVDEAKTEAHDAYKAKVAGRGLGELNEELARLETANTTKGGWRGETTRNFDAEPRIKLLDEVLRERESKYKAHPTQVMPGEVLPKDFKPRAIGGVKEQYPDRTKKVAPAALGAEMDRLERQGAKPSEYEAQVVASDHRAGVLKLREFIRTVPEFAVDPHFTVEGDKPTEQMLRFKDGGTYKFAPAALAITLPDSIKAGERVRIDVEAAKALKAGEQGLLAVPTKGNGVATASPEPTKPTALDRAESKLDKIAADAKDRIKKTTIKRGRNTGSTTLISDMGNTAILVAALVGKGGVKVTRAGLRTTLNLRETARKTIAEYAPHLARHTDTVTNMARRLIMASKTETGLDPERFEVAAADLMVSTERKQRGTSKVVKEETGLTDTSAKVSESDALAAGMKRQQAAASAGFKAGEKVGTLKAQSFAERLAERRASKLVKNKNDVAVPGVANERRDAKTITQAEALKAGMGKARTAASLAYRAARREAGFELKELRGRLTDKARRDAMIEKIKARGVTDDKVAREQARRAIEAGVRKQAVRVIRDNVPRKLWGNYLTAIRDAKSTLALGSLLNRVQKDLAAYEVRRALKAAEKAVGSQKAQAELEPELRDEVDRAAGVLRRIKRAVTSAGISDEVDAGTIVAAAGSPVPPRTSVSVDQLEVMRDELGSVVNAVLSARHQQETLDTVRIRGELKAAHGIREQITARLDTRPELDKGDTPQAREASWLMKTLRRRTNWDVMMRMLDGFKKGGPAVRLFQEVLKGRRTSLELDHAFRDKLGTLATDHGWKSLGHLLAEMSGTLGDGLQKSISVKVGGFDTLTMGQAGYIYAASTDEGFRARLKMVQSLQFRDARTDETFKLTLEDLDTVAAALPAEGRAFIDDAKALYDSHYFDGLSRVNKVLKGYFLDKVQGYWGIKLNRDFSELRGVPTSWRGNYIRAQEESGFMQERLGPSKTPILIGDFGIDLMLRSKSAATVVGKAETTKLLTQTLLHPDVVKAVTAKFGVDTVERIKRRIALYSGGDIFNPTDSTARKVLSMWSRSKTQLWAWTWLRNATSGATRVLNEIGVTDFVKAGLTPSWDAWQTLRRLSPELRERWDSGGVGSFYDSTGSNVAGTSFKEAGAATAKNLFDLLAGLSSFDARRISGGVEGAWKSWGRVLDAMTMGNFFDAFGAIIAFKHFQKQAPAHLSGDARDKWAARHATRVFERVSNTATIEYANDVQLAARDSVLVASLVPFTGDTAKMQAMLYEAFGKGKNNGDWGAVARVVGVLFAGAVASSLVSVLRGAALGDDKDKALLAGARRGVQELVSVAPAGTVLSAGAVKLFDKFTGTKIYDPTVLEVPLVEIVNTTWGAAMDIVEGLARQGKTKTSRRELGSGQLYQRAFKKMLGVVGSAFGVPTQYVGDIEKGVKNWSE